MTQSKRAFPKKLLFAAAAVVLLIVIVFVVKATVDHEPVPPQSTEAIPSGQDLPEKTTAAPINTTQAAEESVPPVEETEKNVKSSRAPLGDIPDEEVRFNYFITGIVQQNIENTETDLDEDAELIRFAFGYRTTNDPGSILEQEYDGTSCRTLTLEQVNETLSGIFGITLSPDQEDYSILNDDSEGFHCVFRDGCFWNIPPYPAEKYSFPVRFALVDKIDEENATLHFRLYRMNPEIWGEGEAARHVPIMPMASIWEAESGDEETRRWITRIGEGDAVLRDLGEDLQLVELVTRIHP